MWFKSVVVFLFAALMGIPVFAQTPGFSGFVRVRPDRELYAEVIPAQAGRPYVVLINGLTYGLRQYDGFARALSARGLGVVRFDPDGMGRTLLRYAPSVAAYPIEQQAKDMKAVLTALGMRPPYSLIGLSYGGGLQMAYSMMYPRDVRHHILVAPYTQPLESQDRWIQSQIWANRQTVPLNPATDDQLYDFFLRQIVYMTYPTAEPVVLENPFKLEATFNLVRGIRRFRPVDVAQHLPAGTIHLMTAVADQYIPAHVLEDFWSKVPPSARMSRIKVFQTEHKMTEVVPDFVAGWVMEILKGNPLLRGGRDFTGWPFTKTVRTGQQEFQLKD